MLIEFLFAIMKNQVFRFESICKFYKAVKRKRSGCITYMQILASDYGIQFVVCDLNTQKYFEVKHVFQIIESSGGIK